MESLWVHFISEKVCMFMTFLGNGNLYVTFFTISFVKFVFLLLWSTLEPRCVYLLPFTFTIDILICICEQRIMKLYKFSFRRQICFYYRYITSWKHIFILHIMVIIVFPVLLSLPSYDGMSKIWCVLHLIIMDSHLTLFYFYIWYLVFL